MNGVVVEHDARACTATVDWTDAPTPTTFTVSLSGTIAEKNTLLVGRFIRFASTDVGKALFLGFGDEANGGDSICAKPEVAPLTGIVTSIGKRHASLSVITLSTTVCMPRELVPCGQALALGSTVDVFLRRGSVLVERVVGVRGGVAAGQRAIDAVQGSPHENTPLSTASTTNNTTGGAIRCPVAKLKADDNVPEEYRFISVKQEEQIEYCSDDTMQHFARRTDAQLGTWTISGFDPSFFFPPELTLRFRHANVVLVNNTPPLVCQGDVIEVELWSYWTTAGTSVDLRIVDENGVDVTRQVAFVSILVRDEQCVTMDGMAAQLVCSFEVTLLPFHMDETCEIFFDVRARKEGLRLPPQIHGAYHLMASSDVDASSVAVSLLSRPVFVRRAMAAAGGSSVEGMLDKDSLSHRFWVRNVLAPHERIVSGFTDPGRSNTLLKDPSTYAALQLVNAEREVLVIDGDDAKLKEIVDVARSVVDKVADTQTRASVLLWYVEAAFAAKQQQEGSSLVLRDRCDDGAPVPLSGNPRKGGRGGIRPGVDSRKRRRCGDTPIQPPVMRLGDVVHGVCRHRSLLYKYLCDALRVPCYLVRGEHKGAVDNEAERHSWNVVLVDSITPMIADATLSPMRLLPYPDTSYFGPDLPPSRDQACVMTPSAHKLTILEECGRGVSASVRRCLIGGLTCVVKMPRQDTDVQIIREEFLLLQKLKGIPNIVKTFGWYKGVILEYYPLSLLALMNMLLYGRTRLGHAQIKQVLVGILTAITHLHSRHYVHRDVKAENVLVNLQRCKRCLHFGTVCKDCGLSQVTLADFADCYSLEGEPQFLCNKAPRAGTVPYAAPEIEFERPFTCAADIWSVGILLSEMLLMQLPDAHSCPLGYQGRVAFPDGTQKTVFVPAPGPSDPPWAERVMSMALKPEWQRRATAAQLLAALTPSDEKSAVDDGATTLNKPLVVDGCANAVAAVGASRRKEGSNNKRSVRRNGQK